MNDHIGEMVGVYRTKSRVRKDPDVHHFWTLERFPVALRRVSGSEAPIAFRMKSNGSGLLQNPRWIEWRVVDGHLMREVLDTHHRSVAPDKLAHPKGHVFSKCGLPWDHPEHFWEDNIDPRDYVYADHSSRAHILDGQATVGNKTFWKWLLDEQDTASERVQASAADLVVIDGTVFRRAAEPCIRVSWSNPYGSVPITIAGCIAEERKIDFEGATWLRADEMETALGLMESIVDGGRDDAGIYSDAPFDRQIPQCEIEITGAWTPRFEAHEAAVGATSHLFGPIQGRSSSLATSMAVNALHLAARAPILGANPISTDEAWSIFCRSANDASADLSHVAMSRMDRMGQLARDHRMAAEEPGLAGFVV